MNYCLRHEACPKCRDSGRDRSGNNLGVFSDGHTFCFSCGYGESTSGQWKQRILSEEEKSSKIKKIRLPDDCSSELPQRCHDWLAQYEIEGDGFLWSEQYQRLIFPIYVNGNLEYYQGRSFNLDGGKHSKYYTEGQPNKLMYLVWPDEKEQEFTTVTVVEDLISALKVGKVSCAMPLWGSHIGPERIRMLSDRFSGLWIWLDKDKAEYSLKSRLNALPYFDEVRSIITDLDPKCYDEKEIKEILN